MMVLPIILDRATMGISLAVHIILASIGIALPILMCIMEFIGIRKNDKKYVLFARRMTVPLIILFAIGTASGIIVAVELFLLWPSFMSLISQVAILPFYIEVFAFFTEAIFLGIYAYSWDKKFSKYGHWWMSVLIAGGATASGALIIMINAFMNTPVGFNIPAYLSTGVLSDINPIAVFNSPSTFTTVLHGVFASIFAGSFIILVYLLLKLRSSKGEESVYYKNAAKVVFAILMISVLVLIISGVWSIQNILQYQPEKYAAIEGNYLTQANAPEVIGGIPAIQQNGSFTWSYAISIPGLQSLLAGGSTSTVVPGLSSYNESTWPPLIVHPMFDIMFFLGLVLGIFLLGVLVIFALRWFKIKNWLSSIDPLGNKKLMIAGIIAGILAIVLLEDGWIMAEFARQPWIIYGVMTVAQAGNPSSSIIPILCVLIAFYILVLPLTLLVLKSFSAKHPLGQDLKSIRRKH